MTNSVMEFFQNLVEPPTERSTEVVESPQGKQVGTKPAQLHQQLFDLNIGSGIFDEADLVGLDNVGITNSLERKDSFFTKGKGHRGMSFLDNCPVKFPPSREPSILAPKAKRPAGIFPGCSPPKIAQSVLPGAFFSQGNSLGDSCPLDVPDQKKRGSFSPNSTDSPLANATRSRNGSTRYVPPIGKYSSEAPRDSDQDRFRQWLSWDNNELEKRKRALLGKTVVGKLSPKRGNRYFVKWNINANDTVVISADKVEEVLGETPPAGMWVACTIVGLGPGHVQWNKQHPYAMTLESRETRASHQPGKGIMPRSSPYWKKSQKAGLTREVENLPDQRATVPAEIDMARYTNARRANQVPRTLLDRAETLPRKASTSYLPPAARAQALVQAQPAVIPMPPPENLPKGIVLPQTVPQPESQTENLARRTNGANINLVTGEIRQRGRADTVGSWRRRDRSFTV